MRIQIGTRIWLSEQDGKLKLICPFSQRETLTRNEASQLLAAIQEFLGQDSDGQGFNAGVEYVLELIHKKTRDCRCGDDYGFALVEVDKAPNSSV